ncbi:hypothetical protein KR032_006462 [Drosophila birchii]|nr:hypothetical protein KR032_006462 [Drosophila birchii]
MEEIQKMEETPGEKDQAVPVPVPVPDGGDPLITPLKVVQTFLAAIKARPRPQELAKNYILCFFKRTYLPWMSGKNAPAHFQHEGFEGAAFVEATNAESHKRYLKYIWRRNNFIEEKRLRLLAEAPSLHLRAESDDEELPPASSPAKPQKPKLDLDNVTFVESFGMLRRMRRRQGNLHKTIKTKLMLGYRLVPVAEGDDSNGQSFEICLASYSVGYPVQHSRMVSEPVDIVYNSSDSNDSSDSSDSSDSFDSSDSSDASELPEIIPLSVARKRCSTSKAQGGQPKRRPGRNALPL